MAQNAAANDTIDAKQVEDYLHRHPTFFLEREQLLTELYLPHASGEAVSLLERQVTLLRERNIDARKRLKEFLEQGERNDELFSKTRLLVLAILEAKNLTDMIDQLYATCQAAFGVEYQRFTLIDAPASKPVTVRSLSLTDASEKMPALSRISKCVSGVFREEELNLLFAGEHGAVQSALVLPIFSGNNLVAIMAFGSDDPKYFASDMDTLFLDFIGDVISRLLPRFLKQL